MRVRPEINGTDRSPILKVLAWVLAVCMGLFVFAKVLGKRLKLLGLGLDDVFAISAMGLAIGQTIALTFQASAGLGRNQLVPSPSPYEDDLSSFEKSTYAAEITYVMALVAAKAASLRLIQTIAPVSSILIAVNVGGTSVGILALVSLFGTAFQCAPPSTWQVLSSHCFDQPAFFVSLNVIDLVLDTFIFLLPSIIVLRLQMPLSRRISIVIPFAMRSLVLPLVVMRIIFLLSTVEDTGGWRDFDLAIITTLQMHFEIVASCIPFLRPLVDQMYHGFTTSDLSRAPITISRNDGSIVKDGTVLRRLPKSIRSSLVHANSSMRASKPDTNLGGSMTQLRPGESLELSEAHGSTFGPEYSAEIAHIGVNQRDIVVHTTITTSIE